VAAFVVAFLYLLHRNAEGGRPPCDLTIRRRALGLSGLLYSLRWRALSHGISRLHQPTTLRTWWRPSLLAGPFLCANGIRGTSWFISLRPVFVGSFLIAAWLRRGLTSLQATKECGVAAKRPFRENIAARVCFWREVLVNLGRFAD